jgi:tRNA dimethylallyltransferase
MVDALSQEYPLVAIVGPTASGKSALALALAERLGGEIVNYDSVQIYRGFDVGTGKLTPAERRGIPHHLLDSAAPHQIITAGEYRRLALDVLKCLCEWRKLPILVGGTGLYLRALVLGLFKGPARSERLRTRLKAMAERQGQEGGYLHRLLRRIDPASAARIHPRDTQKIIRALEVCLLARQPLSAMIRRGREGLHGFRVLKIGLDPERAELRRRIDDRVRQMFRRGLIEEARAAMNGPSGPAIKPLGAIGYRQACAALRGEINFDEAIWLTQSATRRYAKRQMTWFHREPDVTWFKGFGDDPMIQVRILDWLRSRGLETASGGAPVLLDDHGSQMQGNDHPEPAATRNKK